VVPWWQHGVVGLWARQWWLDVAKALFVSVGLHLESFQLIKVYIN
jgi:hypothetical protein